MRDYLKCPYNNPFCWNIIDFNSMYNLISKWDSIDFTNWDMFRDKQWNFYTKIDNYITIKWQHYKFSKTDDVLRKEGIDVFSNKIWEYIAECYDKRTARMLKQNESPTFILVSTWNGGSYSKDELKKLCSIKTPYKIIVANYGIQLQNTPPNVTFYTELIKKNNGLLAKKLYEAYFKL